MEETCDRHRVHARAESALDVGDAPGSPTTDERDANMGSDRGDEIHVEPLPPSFAVDARQENLPRSEVTSLLDPLHYVEPGALPAIVRVRLPSSGISLGFDGEDDALRAE